MTGAAPMLAESNFMRFQASVRDSVRNGGVPGVELIIARMLAAVRLWPEGNATVPGFLDREVEFTVASWEALLGHLGGIWETTYADGLNPFQGGENFDRLRPGEIENLRRIVLSALGSATQVESELIEAALNLLLHDKAGPIARLAPEWENLVVELTETKSQGRIFCGFDSTSGIALKLAMKGLKVRLDLHNADIGALCVCLAIAGNADLIVKVGDPMFVLQSDQEKEQNLFDTAIVVPPIGIRYKPEAGYQVPEGLLPYTSSESGGVALAFARARKRAICVVPPSFLFKTTRADQHFKEVAARQFGLDAVVGLPQGVYPNASSAAAILLFELDRARSRQTDRIFVVDAMDGDRTNKSAIPASDLSEILRERRTGKFSTTVWIEDISANDFNLSPDRYVVAPEVQQMRQLTESTETAILDEIVEIYRPQAILGKKEPGDGSIVAMEIGVADIDDAGLVQMPSKRIELSETGAIQARKAVVEPGDMLLVTKGSVGKVGYVRSLPKDATWLASQSFVVLRLKPRAAIKDARVLFSFLGSAMGQASLHYLRVGSTVPGLQMADIRRLPVILPDDNQQASIVRQIDDLFATQDRIRELRLSLVAQQTGMWPKLPELVHGEDA